MNSKIKDKAESIPLTSNKFILGLDERIKLIGISKDTGNNDPYKSGSLVGEFYTLKEWKAREEQIEKIFNDMYPNYKGMCFDKKCKFCMENWEIVKKRQELKQKLTEDK